MSKQIIYSKAFVSEKGSVDGTIQDAVITSERVDREGDSISVKELNFQNFLQNPILLWSHNSGQDKRPAIGRVDKVWEADGKMHFTPQFDMEDPFAVQVYNKYKKGFLSAFSIGFIPRASEKSGDQIAGEVLEFSAVNVPANPDALVAMRGKGFDVVADWKEWTKKEDIAPEPVAEEPKLETPKVEEVSTSATEITPEPSKVETHDGQEEVKEAKAQIETITGLMKTAITALDEARKRIKQVSK